LKPLRFGAFPSFRDNTLPLAEWTKTVKQIEDLGYSTVLRDDHFHTYSTDPIAMLASAASATKTLKIGSFVFGVDFRHPAVLAKAAATLHLLSSGRFEFGIGAGYRPYDYNATGIPLDPAITRVERLAEAIEIIKSMWTQERTSFSGKHFQISEIEKAGYLHDDDYPKIMIGGGGRNMLRLAAQYADIVGIIPRWRDGKGGNPQDALLESIKKKIIRVKKAAKDFGRDPDEIEFQWYISRTEITDDPSPMIENIAKNYGLSQDFVKASQTVSFGSSSFIQNRIQRLHDETGINYFVFLLRRDQIKEYAESIVQPLAMDYRI
jgi:probable F420-dependent oxidoreductase